jgi:hypothetical protein
MSEDHGNQRNMLQTLFVEAMASCTAITYVHGKLVGDPLDVKMFQSTGWILDESAQQHVSGIEDNMILAYVHPQSLSASPILQK